MPVGEINYYETEGGRSPVLKWLEKHARGREAQRYQQALQGLLKVDLDQPNDFKSGLALLPHKAYDHNHAKDPLPPLYKLELPGHAHTAYFMRHGG